MSEARESMSRGWVPTNERRLMAGQSLWGPMLAVYFDRMEVAA